MRVTPYPVCKPSGVPWLGDVPAHWKVRRLRTVAADIGDLSSGRPLDEPCIALEHVESWTGEVKVTSSDVSFGSQVKKFRAGDVLFGKLRPYLAKVARPSCDGYCVGEFLVLRPRNEELLPDYLEKLLRSKSVIDAVNASTFGAKMPRAEWCFIGNMVQPIPPIREQRAIVRYLDHVDRRVRCYVSAKRKLIGLLEEEKQAVINWAVTRGLDHNAPLKSSGVEWLGDVPEHWEVRRLKQVSTIQTGITLGKDYGDVKLIERPYLRVANVQSGHLNLSEINTVRVPHTESQKTTLAVGDVLMTEGGDIDKLGRGCVWQGEIQDCLHQNHVFAVRPNITELDPEFLVSLIGTSQGRNYFQATAKQTTNLAATNRTTLGEFPMYLPEITEQRAIANYITRQREAKDNAIARARRQIELLEEYRTRLIADVVTGKLDVREAAAELPEDSGGEEPQAYP